MAAPSPKRKLFFVTKGGLRTFAARGTNGSYVQKVYFAKSGERPKITVRVGPARCSVAFPKQTLIRCCSIIEVVGPATRTKLPLKGVTELPTQCRPASIQMKKPTKLSIVSKPYVS